MRVFVAGASGVMGMRLIPLLVAAGHDVAAMTRSPDKVTRLDDLGATPVICDVFDLDSLRDALTRFRPSSVIHELTDLPDDPSKIREHGAALVRVRREGTLNLVTAARVAGASRFIAQSVAWELSGSGAAAITFLEETVLGAGGVVLRYGRWYGPGTWYEDDKPQPPRVHIDVAAARTIAALEDPSGVYLVTDD